MVMVINLGFKPIAAISIPLNWWISRVSFRG